MQVKHLLIPMTVLFTLLLPTFAQAQQQVSIPDANLKAAIQAKIGNTLTTETMLKLTTLEADNLGVRDLTGLEHAKNLTELDLWGSSITDISSLAGLTQLERLELSGSSITDISPLAGLTQLEGLNLISNNVSDISALSGLTQLETLDLDYTSITNISALSGLTQLRNLRLNNNSITNISALSGLTQLQVLGLSGNNVSDISALSGLTQLKSLGLNNNSITNISALSGLTQLKGLGLDNNSISDISPLARLTQLTYLNLRGNPLNAAAISTHIPAIQARGTKVRFDTRAPTTPPAVPDPVQPVVEPNPTPPIAVSLTATSTPTSLTEATLDSSTVTLTLQGGTFENKIFTITGALSTSGISVILPADGLRRDSDTQITMRIAFNSDLTSNGTLTFRVTARGIRDYNGTDLTATLPVSANAESLTVTPSSLTEASLDGSLVRLILRGRKFATNIEQYVTTPGVPGVRFSSINRVSDTEVSVRLAFSGDLNSDTTLTFWINQGGIPSYPYVLTADLRITATVAPTPQQPVETPQLPDLGISNFRVSKTTLTPGEQFTLFATVENRGTTQSSATTLEFQRSTETFDTQIGTRTVSALGGNRSVEVNFPLTAPVQEGVYHYRAYLKITNNHSSWGTITVAAPVTTPVVPTPQPNIAPTPGPTGVLIPDPNLRAAVQQVIGNTITTETMRNLTTLYPQSRGIIDLTGLEHATNLIELRLNGNNISDISSLARLTRLTTLDLHANNISDISPLSGLIHLTELLLHANNISDISALARITQLQKLYLGDNSISDISPLSRLTQLTELGLYNNSISNISPLSGLTQLTHLQLDNNSISDISPLSRLTQLTELGLRANPLNAAAINTHIPAIQARGTQVWFDNRAPTTPQPNVVTTPQPNVVTTPQPNVVTTPNTNVELIPDPNLRRAIQEEIGNTVTTDTIINLTFLDAFGLGIRDLTGLEHARNLRQLYLWGNSISDISPLALLRRLTDLDLHDNNISDISALVRLTRLTDLDLTDNPLNAAAINTHIPAIQARGTEVEFDDRAPTTPPVVQTEKPQVDTRTPIVPIDPSQPAIYWVAWSEGKIQRLEGASVTDFLTGLDEPKGIAVDVSGGKIYWASSTWNTTTNAWVGGKIRCADLDGSNMRTLVTGLDDPQGIALDVAGGKMYWTSQRDLNRATNTFTGKIQSADLDGSSVRDLVTGLEPPRGGIALDIAGGKIYWTDWDKIQSADLDGSNVRTLVTGLYNLTGGIALDIAGGKIYWIDFDNESKGRMGIIQSADLDGSNVRDLVTGLDDTRGGIALDVARGKMYWTSVKYNAQTGSFTGKMQSANLDGSNVTDFLTGLYFPEIIALGVPPQTAGVPRTKTTQVHVDAADRPPMYWVDTAAGTLHRLVGAEVENFVPSVRNATSLTLDVANEKLYWTEKTSNRTGSIRSANLDGTNVQLVKNLTSIPLDITFNAADDKLYLTNGWGKVQRMNVDGSGFQPNLITDLDTPMNIVVDVVNDKLYWTEKTGNTTGSIGSANLDGTNVQLVKALTSAPLDMSLDAADSKLYLTDASGKVQRMNLDGSGLQPNFITGLDTSMHIAVDTAAQHLYLTSSDGKISRRDFSGGGSEDIVTGLGTPGRLVFGDTPLDDQMAVEPATTTRDRAEDVNGDGTVNDEDARLVSEAISKGSTDAKYDVNDDGKVNFDDLQLVLDNRDRSPYDINADGTVDDKDASLVSEAISNGSTDAKYDVNGDGNVNFDDLQLVLDNRDPGAAGAPRIVENLKLSAAQMARIEEQIDLLIATGDGSPAAMRTLIYLQQLLASARPEKTQLLANYPNPFNPETWIPYQLSEDSPVSISIYDTTGKLVRTLSLGFQSAGFYNSQGRAAYWDGRNALGERVASGVYFYQLTTPSFQQTRRLAIVK